MLFEFFYRLISLDTNWLVSLKANNLHWLFLITVLIFIFFDGKKVVLGVIAFFLVGWAWGDFELISGLAVFAGGFLMIYYLSKIAVMIFAENQPELKNKLIWISELQFIIVFMCYNIFLR